ncbi:MAG: chemotaxis protein CheX [Gammaproteobacteria bacterium CG22_combo_CG10-13_8_21_14_all_40_8]|nr:MAG: chemotaxis protein CheX [Gammaproteobacteria bacterium CG22_combo_CG10-13_8_21_14_all_40_8]
MSKIEKVSTDEILLMLCNSVVNVLNVASDSGISFSPMVQKINKTSLSPDLGCFVLFDGGFSGLVIANFSAQAAIEIYQNYMLKMGMPKDELAISHTSDEVGDIHSELMNQILGDFINKVRKTLQTNITQNQPKMLTINKQVVVSIGTTLDRAQMRKVSFSTRNHHIFYLEMAMDKTEFIKLAEMEEEEFDPDTILNSIANDMEHQSKVDNDLLDELDL